MFSWLGVHDPREPVNEETSGDVEDHALSDIARSEVSEEESPPHTPAWVSWLRDQTGASPSVDPPEEQEEDEGSSWGMSSDADSSAEVVMAQPERTSIVPPLRLDKLPTFEEETPMPLEPTEGALEGIAGKVVGWFSKPDEKGASGDSWSISSESDPDILESDAELRVEDDPVEGPHSAERTGGVVKWFEKLVETVADDHNEEKDNGLPTTPEGRRSEGASLDEGSSSDDSDESAPPKETSVPEWWNSATAVTGNNGSKSWESLSVMIGDLKPPSLDSVSWSESSDEDNEDIHEEHVIPNAQVAGLKNIEMRLYEDVEDDSDDVLVIADLEPAKSVPESEARQERMGGDHARPFKATAPTVSEFNEIKSKQAIPQVEGSGREKSKNEPVDIALTRVAASKQRSSSHPVRKNTEEAAERQASKEGLITKSDVHQTCSFDMNNHEQVITNDNQSNLSDSASLQVKQVTGRNGMKKEAGTIPHAARVAATRGPSLQELEIPKGGSADVVDKIGAAEARERYIAANELQVNEEERTQEFEERVEEAVAYTEPILVDDEPISEEEGQMESMMPDEYDGQVPVITKNSLLSVAGVEIGGTAPFDGTRTVESSTSHVPPHEQNEAAAIYADSLQSDEEEEVIELDDHDGWHDRAAGERATSKRVQVEGLEQEVDTYEAMSQLAPETSSVKLGYHEGSKHNDTKHDTVKALDQVYKQDSQLVESTLRPTDEFCDRNEPSSGQLTADVESFHIVYRPTSESLQSFGSGTDDEIITSQARENDIPDDNPSWRSESLVSKGSRRGSTETLRTAILETVYSRCSGEPVEVTLTDFCPDISATEFDSDEYVRKVEDGHRRPSPAERRLLKQAFLSGYDDALLAVESGEICGSFDRVREEPSAVFIELNDSSQEKESYRTSIGHLRPAVSQTSKRIRGAETTTVPEHREEILEIPSRHVQVSRTFTRTACIELEDAPLSATEVREEIPIKTPCRIDASTVEQEELLMERQINKKSLRIVSGGSFLDMPVTIPLSHRKANSRKPRRRPHRPRLPCL